MRRLVWALVLLAACAPAPEGSAAIGVITPSGGDLGVYGEAVRRGVDLAIDVAGGRARLGAGLLEVQAIHRDDHGSAAGAAQSLRELAQEGALAVIGPIHDRLAPGAVRGAADLSIPVVLPWAMDPDLLAGSGFAFSVGYADTAQGRAMAAYAVAEHRAARAAIVADASPYGARLAQGFREAFARRGRRVVASEVAGDLDARRIALAAPDVVFVAAPPRPALAVIEGLRAAGVRAPVVGGDALASPDVALLGGSAVEGVAFPAQWTPLDRSPRPAGFAASYARRYGRPPEVLAALGYDAVALLLDALRRAGAPDREAVRDRLAETAGLRLVTGRLWMGPNGLPDKEISILAWRDGRPHLVRVVRPGAP